MSENFFENLTCRDYKTLNSIPLGIMAYIGDSIYEIIVRNFFIHQGNWDSHHLHQEVIKYVNAGAQRTLLRELENHLTPEERNIIRRGRNSHAGNVPKNANVTDYRYSTGFEAFLGYLFLKQDHPRLKVIISLIEKYLKEGSLSEEV